MGTFITNEGVNKPVLYKLGDIIYAERILDKNNKVIDNRREHFEKEADWIVNLHSAVFVDKNTIYHASAVSGETCTWDFEKFNKYYKLVAVKRVLND